MVSFSVEDSYQGGELDDHLTSRTSRPDPGDEVEMATGQEDDELALTSSERSKLMKIHKQQTTQGNQMDENSSSGEPDDEQLRRMLMCKRLSEGCNRYNPANYVNRKNSLHMIGEELAPVTEGEPMRHFAYLPSDSAASSGSSGSLRAAPGRPVAGVLGQFNKRHSQDDNANTSCSSSTSLDGGPRSPGRRRSSTVSQCSSVLSEGARQQLNFDLSPDLAPDSSLLEANAVSPTDLDERPASPEPSSFSGTDDACLGNSPDFRPVSRMSSACCDELLMSANYSPDSTLADCDGAGVCPQQAALEAPDESSETNRDPDLASVGHNLERLISHVSTVKVSHSPDDDQPPDSKATHKRAHIDDHQQRNKWSASKGDHPTDH